MTASRQPRFQHDCLRPGCCRFVGRTLTSDVYVHRSMLGGMGLIMRHGNDGPDYRSWPLLDLARESAQRDADVADAIKLAESDDYLTPSRRK